MSTKSNVIINYLTPGACKAIFFMTKFRGYNNSYKELQLPRMRDPLNKVTVPLSRLWSQTLDKKRTVPSGWTARFSRRSLKSPIQNSGNQANTDVFWNVDNVESPKGKKLQPKLTSELSATLEKISPGVISTLLEIV